MSDREGRVTTKLTDAQFMGLLFYKAPADKRASYKPPQKWTRGALFERGLITSGLLDADLTDDGRRAIGLRVESDELPPAPPPAWLFSDSGR